MKTPRFGKCPSSLGKMHRFSGCGAGSECGGDTLFLKRLICCLAAPSGRNLQGLLSFLLDSSLLLWDFLVRTSQA